LKFINILRDEFVFEFSEKTAASMLKIILENYFVEFCENGELDPKECSGWINSWATICTLTDQDFLLLCRKLSPTVNLDSAKIDAVKMRELIVKPGAHKTLFPLVLEAGHFALQVEGVKEMFVLNKKGIHHLITTIAEISGKKSVEIQGGKVFNTLKNDNNLAYMLFDIHKLITNELEGPFDGKIVDATNVYREVIPEYKNKESITVPKKMEFMSVNTAKEEFR
jgi:hypothetical protein